MSPVSDRQVLFTADEHSSSVRRGPHAAVGQRQAFAVEHVGQTSNLEKKCSGDLNSTLETRDSVNRNANQR